MKETVMIKALYLIIVIPVALWVARALHRHHREDHKKQPRRLTRMFEA